MVGFPFSLLLATSFAIVYVRFDFLSVMQALFLFIGWGYCPEDLLWILARFFQVHRVEDDCGNLTSRLSLSIVTWFNVRCMSWGKSSRGEASAHYQKNPESQVPCRELVVYSSFSKFHFSPPQTLSVCDNDALPQLLLDEYPGLLR